MTGFIKDMVIDVKNMVSHKLFPYALFVTVIMVLALLPYSYNAVQTLNYSLLLWHSILAAIPLDILIITYYVRKYKDEC